MSELNSLVLVLNKGWSAIHVRTVKDAICDVVSGTAKIIDHDDESCMMHTWESWLTLPVESKRTIKGAKGLLVKVPEIIVLVDYNDIPRMDVKLSRRNLLLRDNHTCQYCGRHVTPSDFTIDHVIPRSRGGRSSWDNFVVACFPCNVRKRNRTPQEAGLVLRTQPHKPKWYSLTSRIAHSKTKESWRKFLPVPVA